MPTPTPPYKDIIVTTRNRIGTIKFNRPSSLNAFGGNLIPETIQAIRDLDSDPDTVFTVLTGEGRFFLLVLMLECRYLCTNESEIGLEGSLTSGTKEEFKSVAEKKLAFLHRFTPALELLRSIISHRKVFVLALNGPAVGGGAAWFAGVVDIILAAKDAYLQVPFSALGLVPENGSAVSFAQSIGVHRANDFLMFGRKLTAEALESWGLVNRIFAKETFHDDVERFLREMLELNDGRSMMEMKRLQNERLKGERMLAVYQSMDALAERFIDGAPFDRFEARRKELEEKSRKRSKL